MFLKVSLLVLFEPKGLYDASAVIDTLIELKRFRRVRELKTDEYP